MTIISERSCAPGLEKAGIVENLQCTKEKMGNNLKTNTASLAVGAAGAGAIALANKYAPVRDGFSKVADKAAGVLKKSGALDTLKDAGKTAFEYLKKNPKMAKTIGVVAAVTVPVLKMIQTRNFHNNGKIEGKYQAIADAKKA